MNIILFSHPLFMNSQSMPRFAGMLKDSFQKLGHKVQVCTPRPYVFKIFSKTKLAKWAGYIDQYVLFPIWVRIFIHFVPANTLFVFSDQALGPWVPLVRRRPHVVHAHDLLALRSAMGLIPENPTSRSGKIYQRYIRWGFQKSKHFISVSNKTKLDLAEYGQVRPVTSEVVYNGLNYPFKPVPFNEAQQLLVETGFDVPNTGVLLHISGNQWYKNVLGVISIYAEYASTHPMPLPLWLIGVGKTEAIQTALSRIPPECKVSFFYKLTGEQIEAAYSVARAFIFPSHAEGFGWPIVEAQACGCAVITTNEAPMNEIGGPEARYLPRLTATTDVGEWSKQGAAHIAQLLEQSPDKETSCRSARMRWASKFNADTAIASYLEIYKRVLDAKPS